MKHLLTKSWLRYLVLIFVALLNFLFVSERAYATKVTFYKSYSYQASEMDSKVSSRAIALEQLKKLLLEEVGTYVISETEVKNYQIKKDHIITLTGGVVLTQVLDEKWDGKTFTMRAKIEIDPTEVSRSIDILRRDREKTRELEEARRLTAEALSEINRLKLELSRTKLENATEKYAKAVNTLTAMDWLRTGVAYATAGRHRNAVLSFGNAIKLYPLAEFYVFRAYAYEKLGDYQLAISDVDKAIQMNPQLAFAYHERGVIYFGRNQYQQAIGDFDMAILLDPQVIGPYALRGFSHQMLGHFKESVNDYSTVIRLSPKDPDIYFQRGTVYEQLGDNQRALSDYQIAARLGSGQAKKYLVSLETEQKRSQRLGDLNPESQNSQSLGGFNNKTLDRLYGSPETRQEYFKILTRLVPDWQVIKESRQFLDYLKYTTSTTGETQLQALKRADDINDAERVAAIYDEFKRKMFRSYGTDTK